MVGKAVHAALGQITPPRAEISAELLADLEGIMEESNQDQLRKKAQRLRTPPLPCLMPLLLLPGQIRLPASESLQLVLEQDKFGTVVPDL